MQDIENVLPISVNSDSGFLLLKTVEGVFLKGHRIAFGRNKTGNQGGNLGMGKKHQSNWQLIDIDLPATGTNKAIGFYEQEALNEAYIWVWNSEAGHTIYVMYGESMTSDIVYRKANLNFSIDPRNFIAEHRAYIYIVTDTNNDKERNVREKALIFTDGHNWQRWINVLSSIATDSYNADKFPYYALKGPHFDADELIDYAVRPPMFCPDVSLLPRTNDDKNKQNLMINKSLSFACAFINTDGRITTLSPWSNPVFVRKTTCGTSKGLPRSAKIKMPAGSPHTERIQLLVKSCSGDFMLYDTIDKFNSSGDNAANVIGDQYWKRTEPWKNFNYDADNNTIEYIYSGDREVTSYSTSDSLDFQNDVPIRSYALTPAGSSLIWCNNLYNYDNLPAETLDKFKIDVVPPGSATGCQLKTVKISVYVYMREGQVTNQFVYNDGGDTERFFGGAYYVINYVHNTFTAGVTKSEAVKFNLTLGSKDGLLGYFAGTPYQAIGTQYLVNKKGELTKLGVVNSNDATHLAAIAANALDAGYIVQKFDFVVPAGQYIFRLAGHRANTSDDYARTSTYVAGIFDRHNLIHNKDQFNPPSFRKEFVIDARNGDVDLWNDKVNQTMLVFTPWTNTDKNWRFVDGYFTESTDSNVGMELCYYRPRLGQNSLKISGTYTDANGFFYAYSSRSRANQGQVIFSFYADCYYHDERQATNINTFDSGYFANQSIVFSSGKLSDRNKLRLKGRIVNCETGLGIPSVGVTLGQSPTFYTDADGYYELRVMQEVNGLRADSIYYNFGGACQFVTCDCQPVDIGHFEMVDKALPCGTTARSFPQGEISLKAISVDAKGPKGGGRYGICAQVMDLAGRTTFAQNIGYADIPTFMETGSFLPSYIKWTLTGKLNLPSWAKYITFGRTSNRNFETYLQWVGDKIEFIDNKGNTVTDGSGAIRAKVTIQSLLNFNVVNNFNTNVRYQFVAGDIMRIMDNGEGKLFSPLDNDGYLDFDILGTDYNQSVEGIIAANVAAATQTTTTTTTTGASNANTTVSTAVVKVNPNAADDGKSFVIDYDERLLTLKDKTGFWIEILRPKDISTIEDYCEIVGTVPVLGGEPTITEGVFDFFDTYYQLRNVQVPNAPGKALGHPFESASVSDFSLGDCSSCGRRNIKDPQAAQTWYPNQVIKSDDTINAGRINGLGRCRSKNKKDFKTQSFGGIVAAHAERNRLLFICENDWFTSDFDMNFVRVTEAGLIIADLNQALTDPHPREGSNYGCAYEDTATISFMDGTACWADRHNSAIIFRAGNSVMDLAAEDNKSYFINKFNEMIRHNSQLLPGDDYLQNLIELISGRDPQTGEIHFTFRPRNGLAASPDNFTNDEREVFYDSPETFIFNPELKKWATYANYTPEFYGRLGKARSGIELITFANGKAWFHNSIGQPGVNNFYGVQTNHVIEVALNVASKKVKIFQAVIINSPDAKYFIDRVRTEDENFHSYITPAHFIAQEQVLYAPFLQNMNTYPDPIRKITSALMDGKRTFGKVAIVRVVGDINNMGQYSELNGIGYRITGSEQSEGQGNGK